MSRIELAAIKYNNYIYVGLRHAWIRDMIFDMFDVDRLHFVRNFESGFITNRGEFVTREEALKIVFENNQIKKTIGGVLTSEDLW
jgi:hypothetical protein